jgi:hypothetical protein
VKYEIGNQGRENHKRGYFYIQEVTHISGRTISATATNKDAAEWMQDRILASMENVKKYG